MRTFPCPRSYVRHGASQGRSHDTTLPQNKHADSDCKERERPAHPSASHVRVRPPAGLGIRYIVFILLLISSSKQFDAHTMESFSSWIMPAPSKAGQRSRRRIAPPHHATPHISCDERICVSPSASRQRTTHAATSILDSTNSKTTICYRPLLPSRRSNHAVLYNQPHHPK